MNLPSSTNENAAISSLENIGHSSGEKISVQISTRFLEHFSKQLYSSPQKAFEELISNGWDAGADYVDVRISDNLKDSNATMCVLDNGASMDADGLRQLWHIAFSPKTEKPVQNGRHVIGKFGIGKLATYVLADKLTYICKASDGVIRRVTMDYSVVDSGEGATDDKLINNQNLDIYEVTEEELSEALKNVSGDSAIHDLIKANITKPAEALGEDEFEIIKEEFKRPTSNTWTLAVLTGLKPTGREMKVGVLRRMLESALPFGSEMAICLNGELLKSSKIDFPTMLDWRIDSSLNINSVELKEEDDGSLIEVEEDAENNLSEENLGKDKSKLISIPVTATDTHIEIAGLGKMTGRIRLFQDVISGGKSVERGASNGFHINVLGRLVNQDDISFGEKNLSHAAWARFRMAVRADGLNDFLTINREGFKDQRELKIFRAFLRKVFNRIRTHYDNDKNAALPDGGDILVRSLGVLSLNSLRNVVSSTLASQSQLPGLFDESGIENREEKREAWWENTSDHIQNALSQVKYEKLDDDSFAKFRISDGSIVVNKEHPFAEEHSRSKAEKELVRTIAMVNLLADVYALDIGVDPTALKNIRQYRDRLMRYRAMQSRQSGIHIASLLLKTQHESDDSKQLEAVLSDALRYLGFHVRDLAKNGEPEGIASAYAIPTLGLQTSENPHPPLYTFAFDAKSSIHKAAKTNNINIANIKKHRNDFSANYSLVVAPGYEKGNIESLCAENQITPLTARDLGRLLTYTVEHGAVPITKFREIFDLYEPEKVSNWVNELEQWLKSQRKFTIDIFIKALTNLKGKVPEALPASMIVLECSENLKVFGVKNADVIAVAQGLAVLIPDLLGVDGDKIVVNASAERVAAAIQSQLEKLHQEAPEKIDSGG